MSGPVDARLVALSRGNIVRGMSVGMREYCGSRGWLAIGSEMSREAYDERADISLNARFQMTLTWTPICGAPRVKIDHRRNVDSRGISATEFALCRAGGSYGQLLKICHEVLSSIPTTFVECEREFSCLRLILGEHRGRLNPDTVDDLFMLRKSFKKKAS